MTQASPGAVSVEPNLLGNNLGLSLSLSNTLSVCGLSTPGLIDATGVLAKQFPGQGKHAGARSAADLPAFAVTAFALKIWYTENGPEDVRPTKKQSLLLLRSYLGDVRRPVAERGASASAASEVSAEGRFIRGQVATLVDELGGKPD